MTTSIFTDKSHTPSDQDLASVLGRSKMHWDGIKEYCSDRYGPLTSNWNFPGAKYGWSHRLIQKKRTILYMIPNLKCFDVAFVLGERAAQDALSSDIPQSIKKLIREAKKYVEGIGIRFEIRTKKDVEIVKKLAEIKMMK
jgi:hypothetical protein